MTFNKKTSQSHKTKLLLRSVLNEMLKKATIEDVTIKAIVQEANITRSTFYTHYQDKYALMEDLIMQNYEEMYSIMEMNYENDLNTLEERFKQNFHNVLDSLYSNRHLYSQMSSQSRSQMISKGLTVIQPVFMKQLDSISSNTQVNTSYMATFFLNGLFAIYNQWIGDEFNVSVDELSQQLTDMMIAQLKCIL